MRVHVDPDRCQGHNRCYALAPELFDVDDHGNAPELNDGVVPEELEEKARLAAANCPEYAISITEDVMTQRPPVTDWATDFDHTDPQWVADPYPIWDELRDGVSGRAHRPLRRRVAARYPRGRRRGRVRHRALHVAVGRHERAAAGRRRPPGADRRRAADHLRPAVPHAGPPACCCRRSGPKAIAALEPFTRALCHELLDAIARQGAVRRRGRLRAAHPAAGHRADARFPAGGRRPVPPVHPHRPRRRRRVGRGAPGAGRAQASSTTTSTPRIEEHLAEPRDDLTSFLLEAELDGSKLHPDHVRGTMVLLMIAGIDTTWSAIGASLWHLAQHPDDRAAPARPSRR